VVVVIVCGSRRRVGHKEQGQAEEEDHHAGIDSDASAIVVQDRFFRARSLLAPLPLHDLPPGLTPVADSVTKASAEAAQDLLVQTFGLG